MIYVSFPVATTFKIMGEPSSYEKFLGREHEGPIRKVKDDN